MAIEYIAQHTYYIAKGTLKLGGCDFEGESYLEVAHPSKYKRDERSAEEIKQDLIKRLSE